MTIDVPVKPVCPAVRGDGQAVHVPALVELEAEPVGVAGEVVVLVGDHRRDRVG